MRRKALKQKKIWNPALYGIRNPLSWNPESSSRNPESTGWNPESKTVMHGFPYMGRKWHERPKWPLITAYYHVIQLSRITYHSHSVYQWNQRDIDTGIFSLWIQTDRYRCVGNGEYHRHSLKEQKSGLICRENVTPKRFYQASSINSKMMVMMRQWVVSGHLKQKLNFWGALFSYR